MPRTREHDEWEVDTILYRFGWIVDETEVDWWIIDLDDDEEAAREAKIVEEEIVEEDNGGRFARLREFAEGGTVVWEVADERTVAQVRANILAHEQESHALDRLDPDQETPYAVYGGHAVHLEERDRNLCHAESYGQGWIVVYAKNPEEAVEQARLYENGQHYQQRRMEDFAKAIRQGVLPSIDQLEDAEPGEMSDRLDAKHASFDMLWDLRRGIREGSLPRSVVENTLDTGPVTEEEKADLHALLDELMPSGE